MYEAIIGLEIHVQLDTKTKMFSADPVVEDGDPNTAVSPINLGHPGTLPTVNTEAVHLALKAALATSCTIHPTSVFARKQYFYADLTKGYQISQYDRPLATGGELHLDVDGQRKVVRIERIHLEEDTGKTTKGPWGTRVDYNRAGTPLIEIVSEADMRTPEEAEAYLRTLHRVLVEAGITKGDLEKGHFRCDVNVSVHEPGTPWGTKVEVKNVNSMRFAAKAVGHEIKRQIKEIGKGHVIRQETRSWQGDKTVLMRVKEGAADYRYFPEPDLPPLRVSPAEIEAARAELPGVPLDLWLAQQDAQRLADFRRTYELDEYTATVLLGDEATRAFFEAAVAAGGASKAMANWVQGDLRRKINDGQALAAAALTPAALVALQGLVDDGTLNDRGAKKVFDTLWDRGGDPHAIVEELGLVKITDPELLRGIVAELIAAHPEQVDKFKAGNRRVVGFFMGQVMKRTQGRADPGVATRLVNEMLEAT